MEVIESLSALQAIKAAELCDDNNLDGAAEAFSCKTLLDRLANILPGNRYQVAAARRRLIQLTGWKPKPKTKGELHVEDSGKKK